MKVTLEVSVDFDIDIDVDIQSLVDESKRTIKNRFSTEISSTDIMYDIMVNMADYFDVKVNEKLNDILKVKIQPNELDIKDNRLVKLDIINEVRKYLLLNGIAK